ncbi:hypothetical protein [Mesorhizobium sp. M0778]|uniref:hypothetical protein n=1 Tax=Mesorhizobium sp. M0778 TaxID=2956999 RepID=UPI00333BFDBA
MLGCYTPITTGISVGEPLPIQKAGAKIAVPEYERHLFDNVEAHWQARRIYDNYNDSNTFFSLGDKYGG